MANIPEYGCTRCNTPTSRDDLIVKKSLFTEMGEGGRSVRSRVTDWLCQKCREEDPDWNLPKFNPPRMVKSLVQSG